MIGIVGVGFVGNALYQAMLFHGKKETDFYLYDKNRKLGSMQELIYKCNDIFVCVPTPMMLSGECDIDIVKSVFREAEKYCKDLSNKLFIIKSTVPPTTCDMLERVFNTQVSFQPEFLNQRTAVEDMKKMDCIAIGGRTDEIRRRVLALFTWIDGNSNNVVYLDNISAELSKYCANIQLAGQIAVANSLYQIVKEYGKEWKPIKDIMLFDPLMGKTIDVPGHDGKFGFGGACLPKDICAFIHAVRERGFMPNLLQEIWRFNTEIRNKKEE